MKYLFLAKKSRDCEIFGLKAAAAKMEKEMNKLRVETVKNSLNQTESIQDENKPKLIKINKLSKNKAESSEMQVKKIDFNLVKNYYDKCKKNGNIYLRPILSRNQEWVELKKDFNITDQTIRTYIYDDNFTELLELIDQLILKIESKNSSITYFEVEFESVNKENYNLKTRIAQLEERVLAREQSNGEVVDTYNSLEFKTVQNVESLMYSTNRAI